MIRRRVAFLPVLSLYVWLCWCLQAQAQNSNSPVLLTADSLKHDQSLGLVIAEGNVELSQDGRTLLADLVSYSEKDNRVAASGNVSLMETDGTVIFADYMELTDGMRNGFIRDASFLLSDNSRGVAAYGERRDGNTTVMRKAVYTTCSLCPTDPTRAPLWQLKGNKVTHDQQAQQITYNDAIFELFGLPVLYTPYFSHPDPTVNRRSGFLPPTILSSDYLGFAYRQPYYVVIDDYSDLTIAPQYSTDQGGHIYAQYRQRMARGEIDLDGSITRSDKFSDSGAREQGEATRGHFRANTAFRANDDVTFGANIFRASDQTYISRYDIPEQPYGNSLVSRAYAEAINGRHYAAANAFSFQSLLTTVNEDTVPFVAPILDYSAIGEPGKYGGRWGFDANMMTLFREQGADTRRLSSTISWSQPYFAPSGEVYTATAMLRGDVYWTSDFAPSQGMLPNSDEDEFSGRAIPLVALDWRYPLVSDSSRVRHLIEPMIGAVVTPYGGNSDDIPNEDSLSLEFDETNLFSFNRYPGYDRWDGGPKLNYGLRSAVYGLQGGYSELFVGQSLRAKADDTFAAGSGLDNRLSDYVARLMVSPGRYITLIDRVRLAQNSTLDIQRHEISANLGTSLTYLSLTYADLGNTSVDGVGEREAVSATLRLQLSRYWSTEFQHTRDLGENGGSLLNFGSIRYTDECFDIALFAQRTFTQVRDVQPTTVIGVRFRIATFS